MPSSINASIDHAVLHRRRLSVEALAAGTIGNVVEWYDFGLYGFFVPILAHLFFPSTDHIAALIGAYGGFAIGFAMRPIGGAVLGHLGDRIGRRFLLVFSVVMMGGCTAAIAILPTYAQAGLVAPVLLLLVRIFQGFSVGGEFTGSVSYLIETSSASRRGFAGSFANIGSTAGMLLAAGAAAVAVSVAHGAALYGWAWRLPFLFGGVLGILGYLLRRRLSHPGYEPDAEALKQADPPLKRALKRSRRAMIYATLFTTGYGIINYLTMVFLPTYASAFSHIQSGEALRIATAAQGLALVMVPVAGWLTDNAVRRRTMLIAVFVMEFVVAWAAFALVQDAGVVGLWAVQMLFGFLLALVMGTAPAMLAEMFPGEYRLSGYSVSFNIGLGIGGGTAPMVATALIAASGNLLAPAWYLMLAGLLGAGAIFMVKDRSREPLR